MASAASKAVVLRPVAVSGLGGIRVHFGGTERLPNKSVCRAQLSASYTAAVG